MLGKVHDLKVHIISTYIYPLQEKMPNSLIEWSCPYEVRLNLSEGVKLRIATFRSTTSQHFRQQSHQPRYMAGSTRSRSGCWTCRLRRKKCDERRPGCETCERLGISCHGYANRPEWMDGGVQEKAKAAEVRRDIKNAIRRDGPDVNKTTPLVQEPSPRVSPTPEFQTHLLPRHGGEIDSTLSTGTNQSDRQLLNSMLGLNVDLVGSTTSGVYRGSGSHGLDWIPTSDGSGDNDQRQIPVIKERDASLLMYYMDCVFPMQFKMYNPAPVEGGRGWLLSMLLRTPPLYYMSLALAAHCMEVLENPDGSDESKGLTGAQLTSALQNLQQYISVFNEQPGPGDLEENIKVLVCIMQMIGFVVSLSCL